MWPRHDLDSLPNFTPLVKIFTMSVIFYRCSCPCPRHLSWCVALARTVLTSALRTTAHWSCWPPSLAAPVLEIMAVNGTTRSATAALRYLRSPPRLYPPCSPSAFARAPAMATCRAPPPVPQPMPKKSAWFLQTRWPHRRLAPIVHEAPIVREAPCPLEAKSAPRKPW